METENRKLNYRKIVFSCAICLLLVIILLNLPFTIISAGNRGVVFNRSTGIEDRVLTEGVHFRTPFIEKVYKLNVQNRTTTNGDNALTAGSAENQSILIKWTANWHLNPNEVNRFYQEIGNQDPNHLVSDRVEERIKIVVSTINAQDILKKGTDIKLGAFKLISEDLLKYHIVLDALLINDIDYLPAYNAAIEAKVKAEQDALAAKNKLDQVQYEAQQKVVTAKAEAEAIKIKGDALKDNPELVSLNAVEKWNGVLPTYVMSGSIPFIQIPSK